MFRGHLPMFRRPLSFLSGLGEKHGCVNNKTIVPVCNSTVQRKTCLLFHLTSKVLCHVWPRERTPLWWSGRKELPIQVPSLWEEYQMDSPWYMNNVCESVRISNTCIRRRHPGRTSFILSLLWFCTYAHTWCWFRLACRCTIGCGAVVNPKRNHIWCCESQTSGVVQCTVSINAYRV